MTLATDPMAQKKKEIHLVTQMTCKDGFFGERLWTRHLLFQVHRYGGLELRLHVMSGFAAQMLAGQWTRPPCCKAPSLCGRSVHWRVCEIACYIPPRVWPVLLCISPWAVDVYICQWDHGAAVCGQLLTGFSDVKSFSVARTRKKNLHTSRNRSVQLFIGSVAA